MRGSTRTFTILTSLVLVGVGFASGAAAATGAPTVTVSTAVNQFDVTLNYTISRKAKDITSQTCQVTNVDTNQVTAVTCDPTANAGSTGKLSRFSVSIRRTVAGSYTFRVGATVVGSATVTYGSAGFNVAPGTAATFDVSGLVDQKLVSGSGTAGFPYQTFAVQALDQYGNRATDYHGTVHFEGGDYTWPASGGSPATTLPADSTLTGGRGVFSMNIGTIQSDCHYGDIASPACDDYMRITATDTVNPAITGYQRFFTVIIIQTPNIFITPPAGVCTSCAVDPSGTLQVDTSQPVSATVISLSGLSVTLSISGTTVQGGGFSQTITANPIVGLSGSLSGTLVAPTVGQTGIQVNLAVVGNLYGGDLTFGNVKVNDPYTGAVTTVSGTAYSDAYVPPVCDVFGAVPASGCV